MTEAGNRHLAECIRFSRLLGKDPSLVLHGGGNTSVKTPGTDIVGQGMELIHVKGSGHDLAAMTEAGFAPLRRARLLELAGLDRLSDTEMVREVRQASLDPDAPRASIEALVHAVIHRRFVLHSHADAIVTLTNASLDDHQLRDIMGPGVEVLPYCMPGFDLARAMRVLLARPGSHDVNAVVHRHHGLFTFDDQAEPAYARHLELVERAMEAIGPSGEMATVPLPPRGHKALARLRREVSEVAGQPMLLRQHLDAEAMRFIAKPDLASIVTRGTATLEHVIRTKAEPCLGTDVHDYARRYRERFERFAPRSSDPLTMLDPAPRVILDAELGFIAVGRSETELDIVHDVYRHTMRIIEDAERIGTYRSLGGADLFGIEYWELEQAKLASARSAPPLRGEVAVLCADGGSFGEELAQGLADSGATLARLLPGDGINEVCDIVERFGGVDIVVSARERPTWWDAARVLLELSPRGVRSIRYGHGDSQRWVTVSHNGQTARLDVPAGRGVGLIAAQLCLPAASC